MVFQDANKIKLIVPIVVGLAVFFLPTPAQLSLNAWIYASIFAALIVGLILEPIPPAFIGVIAITTAVLLKVGPVGSGKDDLVISGGKALKWGLSGFSNSVVWLIFVAFMIGLGYQKSGLGKRIALFLVSKIGKSTLGLGYAIAISDGILSPFVPSNAARSGGILYPIITSIPPMFGSYPEKDARKIGSYLAWTALAATCVTSSVFLTGQAPNPLAAELAAKAGTPVVGWAGWFLAFLPVGIVLFLLTPLLAYIIYPPEIKKSEKIALWAKEEYKNLGKMKGVELSMLLISLFALVFWIGGKYFGIHSTTTAFMVVILMIATHVIKWSDFLSNKGAWNVLVWFGTLVTMAGGLKNVGFLAWLAGMSGDYVKSLDTNVVIIGLLIAFSALRYFFASGTAYTTAVVGLFAVLLQGIPGIDPSKVMLILLLPMGLMGVLTPYATGHSPVWFASHYIKGPDFWRLGAIFGIIYLFIFVIIGIPWIDFIYPHL
ncbi:MAG: anion permease [Proteobacteria bacterium]|nr:MAG: anion permease [Pseudomonadota bacterium]